MDFLVAIAIVGAPIVGVIWYYRAYREARNWKEVHVSWGTEQQRQAIAIHEEMTRQGIRALLKTSGTYTHMMRPFERPHASIRVHRDDLVPATEIVHALTQG